MTIYRRLGGHTVGGMIITLMIIPFVFAFGLNGMTAFGLSPVLGGTTGTLEHFKKLVQLPGMPRSLLLSLSTGVVATILSFLLAFSAFVVGFSWFSKRGSIGAISIFLSIPHAALALGLAFLIAPSGWIARLLAQALGWPSPPDLATVNDPFGMALVLGLIIKETPFFVLMIFASTSHLRLDEQVRVSLSLGNSREFTWLFLLLPQVWKSLRFPFLIVLAYSTSVVDIALILGPSNPPTLAVVVSKLYTHPDLSNWFVAAAGSAILTALIFSSFGLLILVFRCLSVLSRILISSRHRPTFITQATVLLGGIAAFFCLLAAMSLVLMAVWSISWRWSFPNILPEQYSFRPWTNLSDAFGSAFLNSITLAVISASISVVLSIAWLETEKDRNPTWRSIANGLLMLPLVVPQISFVFGLNTLFVYLSSDYLFIFVAFSHILQVFPYVFLALAGTWRSFDPRFYKVAASLGQGSLKRLVKIKIPILLAPILIAFALGFAVSFAQYLPTLIIGAGRIPTLTTEAVALASGSDRRISGVYAVSQAAAPAFIYAICLLLPFFLFRNRRHLLLRTAR